jgi:hypothetical protein
MKYKDHIDMPFNSVLEYGSVIHDVLATINGLCMKMKDNLVVDEVKDIFDKKVKKLDLTLSQYTRTWESVLDYSEKTFVEARNIVGIEYPIQIELNDGDEKIWLVGFIDKLVSLNGVMEITDYKISSKITSRDDLENDDQLSIYAYVMSKKRPDITQITIAHYAILAKVKTTAQIDLTRLTETEDYLIERWRRLRTDKTFDPNPGCMECSRCPKPCKEYKDFLERTYESKGWTDLEEKAKAKIRLSEQINTLKKEVDLLSDDIKLAIENNMGEPIKLAEREWYIASVHKNAFSVAEQDYSQLKSVKVGVKGEKKTKASKKVMDGLQDRSKTLLAGQDLNVKGVK